MKFELQLRHPGPHVIGDPAYPKLTVYYISRQYPDGDISVWTFQRVWCAVVGHRWWQWEPTKYVSGRSRQCQRCGRFDSRS